MGRVFHHKQKRRQNSGQKQKMISPGNFRISGSVSYKIGYFKHVPDNGDVGQTPEDTLDFGCYIISLI
jgi:hypothetical protein